MRITADRNALRDALKVVAPAVARPGTVGIEALYGVRIHATKKAVTVCASNLDLTLEADLAADVDEAGTAVIPLRFLARLVGRMPAGPVELAVKPDTDEAHLITENTQATLRCYQADTWPRTPEANGDTAKIDNDTWRRIAAIAPIAGTEAGRPILTGIHLEGGHAAATDSYRLAWVDVPELEGLDVLVPAATIAGVDPGDGPVVISANGPVVSIATDTVTATGRTIEGDYPDWRRLVPTDQPLHVRVNRSALDEAIATVDVLSSDTKPDPTDPAKVATDPLSIRTDGGRLIVAKRARDVGEASVSIPCDGELEVTIGLNGGYTRSLLALVDVDDVTIGATDALKLISFSAGDHMVGALMPVRIS